MSKETTSIDGEIVFEQPYLMGRVIKHKDSDVHTLQFAGLGTATMSVEVENEETGKMIYGILEDYIKESMKNFITELGNKLEEAQQQAES